MTNPNDAIGTNAGYNGRTTPNAFNDDLSCYSRGVMSGWVCSPKSGMTVKLGGDGANRDVAIAEDNAGNKTTINNRLATPVEITIPAAPATGNRIDLIVAYVNNPPTGAGATSVDFQNTVGIIVVKGTAAANPTAPSESTIRSAITTDGATGASAYYAVLASIYVGTSVSTIGSGAITQGTPAQLQGATIADGAINSAKINWNNLGSKVATSTAQTNIAQAGTTITSLSLSAGTYILIGVISHGHDNASTADYVHTLIKNGSTTIASGSGYLSAYWNSQNVATVGIADLTGTTTISLVGATSNGNTDHTTGTSSLAAIRIG